MRLAPIYLVAAALLQLVGCASLNVSGPMPSAAQESAAFKRTYQETLNLTGRLSVRYQSGSQDQALHGSFSWEQRADHTTITLLSPLGQTVAIINVTPGSASLAQSGQAVRVASDVDTLTAQALGWPLPVGSLREWLQGFVASSRGSRTPLDPATPEVDSLDGWHIRYASWTDDQPTAARPKRIDLRRLTPQAGEVIIRIVIDTWQTP